MMPFNVFARVKNMTRETKLGLAVSCSFLALLGVVLVLKMTERPEEQQGEQVAAAAPNETPPKTKPAPAEAQQTIPPEGNTPPPMPSDVGNTAITLTGGSGAPGTTATPTSRSKGHDGDGADPKNAQAGGLEDDGLPPIPAVKSTATGDDPPPPPLTSKPTNSEPPLPPVGDPPLRPVTGRSGLWGAVSSGWGSALQAAKTMATAPPVARAGATGQSNNSTGSAGEIPPLPPIPGDTTLPAPPVDGPKVAGGGGLPPIPGTEGTQQPGKKKPTEDADPMTVAALSKAEDAAKGSKGSTTGTTTPLPPPPPMTENHDTVPPLPDLPPKTGAGNTGGTASPPPLPTVPGKKDTPPLPPAPDLPPAEGMGKTGSAVAGTGTVKPKESVPSIDVGTIGVGSTGSKPTKVNDLPPAGTKPPVSPHPAPAKEEEPIVVGMRSGGSVPPLSLSPAPATVRSTRPDVVSYTEDSYVAATGDTFQSISKAKYGTDAYGHALYLFNRSHPLAGDELLQSDTLRAKQMVYVPPAQVLRSRYASVISDTAAPAVSGVTVGTTARRADASPASSRPYRVAAGGEKVYDIARNLLGDGNRWVEIQKLNPGWKWEVPIPADVILQVPADAQLPR